MPRVNAPDRMQIGEVASAAGLSLRTVRYYEEMGLLEPVERTRGGFRLYTAEQIERLRLITELKPLGFTVREIREVLDAHDVLGDAKARAPARERAAATLRRYAKEAAGRVEDLRAQASRAEQAVNRLRRRARRARTVR